VASCQPPQSGGEHIPLGIVELLQPDDKMPTTCCGLLAWFEIARGSAGREFALLRAWREDYQPAALGKRSALPATSTNRTKWLPIVAKCYA
jgi:hypothetical protein